MVIHGAFWAFGGIFAIVLVMSKLVATETSQTVGEPTLISEGTVLPWKVRMMVAVVILFPSFVIMIFCAPLTPCSLRLSTMSSTGVNLSSLHRMTPLMVFSVLMEGIF